MKNVLSGSAVAILVACACMAQQPPPAATQPSPSDFEKFGRAYADALQKGFAADAKLLSNDVRNEVKFQSIDESKSDSLIHPIIFTLVLDGTEWYKAPRFVSTTYRLQFYWDGTNWIFAGGSAHEDIDLVSPDDEGSTRQIQASAMTFRDAVKSAVKSAKIEPVKTAAALTDVTKISEMQAEIDRLTKQVQEQRDEIASLKAVGAPSNAAPK